MQSSRQVRLGASGGHDGDPVAEDAPDSGGVRRRAGYHHDRLHVVGGQVRRARVRAWWMQTGQVPVRMTYTATARAWPRRSAGVTRLPEASRTLRLRGNRCSVWTGMTTSKALNPVTIIKYVCWLRSQDG